MCRGTYARCVAFGLIQILLSFSGVSVHAAQVEGCRAAAPIDSQDVVIVIDSVELQDEPALTPEIRARLLKDLKQGDLHASSAADLDWRNELGEKARLALQDQGYFTVSVDINSGLISAEGQRLHYWIALQITSGPQYRLGEVRFENASIFPDRLLKPEISLREGEVFNASAIREGLTKITRLYGNRGYIDATIEPRFSLDDEARRIDIIFRLEPGAQYRIGAVQVRGWSSAAEKLLRSKFEFGQVFDLTALNEFLAENKTLLPSGATEENSVTIQRDPHGGTIDIVFEYRSCQTP
jgi:outer membrane translocation and assembly module TamA